MENALNVENAYDIPGKHFKGPAMAWPGQASALFIIHETNLQFIIFLAV